MAKKKKGAKKAAPKKKAATKKKAAPKKEAATKKAAPKKKTAPKKKAAPKKAAAKRFLFEERAGNDWAVDCETRGHDHLGDFPNSGLANTCRSQHENQYPDCIVHVTGPQ